MPADDNSIADGREREYIEALQADVERMRLESRESNRATMTRLEMVMIEKFRVLREERGWSQSELSDRLAEFGIDMHQTTIAKLEAGKRPLRVSEMFGLSHTFGMPPGAVFSMTIREENFGSLEALQQELARTEQMVADFREKAMELFGTYVDVAGDFGVKRDHLIKLMRESSTGTPYSNS